MGAGIAAGAVVNSSNANCASTPLPRLFVHAVVGRAGGAMDRYLKRPPMEEAETTARWARTPVSRCPVQVYMNPSAPVSGDNSRMTGSPVLARPN